MEIDENEYFNQPMRYMETIIVVPGVTCHVFQYVLDNTKDLGVINIQPGTSTPLQKVLSGERTVEGLISGKGKLIVHRHLENNVFVEEIHYVNQYTKNTFAVDIRVGDMMQWVADEDSELNVYEVCFPPYEEGRFENIQTEL